jgi:hypothetical protein
VYDTFNELLSQHCSALELVAGVRTMRGRRTNSSAQASPKKDKRINLRVTSEQYQHLLTEAGGKTTVSDLVLSKMFGGGMRNHDTLRQVAALHDLGMSLRSLSQNPSASKLHIQAALVRVREMISSLAKQLP